MYNTNCPRSTPCIILYVYIIGNRFVFSWKRFRLKTVITTRSSRFAENLKLEEKQLGRNLGFPVAHCIIYFRPHIITEPRRNIIVHHGSRDISNIAHILRRKYNTHDSIPLHFWRDPTAAAACAPCCYCVMIMRAGRTYNYFLINESSTECCWPV